jgi:Holliday junction resolvase-like predicted endonuclease
VRLADEHPEAFLVKIPLSSVKEGSISDAMVIRYMKRYSTDSDSARTRYPEHREISPILPSDRNKMIIQNKKNDKDTHPPSPKGYQTKVESPKRSTLVCHPVSKPPGQTMNREEIRFLADIAARPVSTTVSRYQRLNLSRRRGNAIRQHLAAAGIIEAVPIATRSGQVVLYQLTDSGRSVCLSQGLDPGPRPRQSLEHAFWVRRAVKHYESQGYEVVCEHPVKGNGAVDLVAKKGARQIAVEVETGKSDIQANLDKVTSSDFDKIVFIATSPAAVTACQKVIRKSKEVTVPMVEQLTWFDIS